MGNVDEEIKGYNKQLLRARQLGDREREGEILLALGIIYSTTQGKIDTAKAIDYHIHAIGIFREQRKWFSYYRASESLGAIYEFLLHDLQTALRVYETAIRQGGSVLSGSREERRKKGILHSISRVEADLGLAE